MIDTKIQEIAKRREFTNFWEAFEYMIVAGYPEIEAIMIGLKLFNGKLWDNVVNAALITPNNNIMFSSGYTTTMTISSINGILTDSAMSEPEDLMVEVYIMTKNSNPIYKAMYKSYAETRKYDEIPELENHIKAISFTLTTELGMSMFKNGYKKIK